MVNLDTKAAFAASDRGDQGSFAAGCAARTGRYPVPTLENHKRAICLIKKE